MHVHSGSAWVKLIGKKDNKVPVMQGPVNFDAQGIRPTNERQVFQFRKNESGILASYLRIISIMTVFV